MAGGRSLTLAVTMSMLAMLLCPLPASSSAAFPGPDPNSKRCSDYPFGSSQESSLWQFVSMSNQVLANQQNFVLTELSKKIYSLQEELVSMKKEFKDELIAMKTELVSMKLTLDEHSSRSYFKGT